MGEHHEVRHERLYLKEPGTDRVRKRAAARLSHLLSTGWRETERWHAPNYITVRIERSGVVPKKVLRATPPAPRPPSRDGRGGGFQGRGGPR